MSLVHASEIRDLVAAGRKAAYEALGGRTTVALTMAPLSLLALLDAFEGSDGYTRLVRDDATDRLHAEVDRLHEQIMLLVACRDDGRAK
jgi:hypothetical protein